MAVHIFYNAQKGEGLTICYMRYITEGIVFANAKNCQKWPSILRYIICGRPLSRARHNNNCKLVSFHCFAEYEIYYSLESARLSYTSYTCFLSFTQYMFVC